MGDSSDVPERSGRTGAEPACVPRRFGVGAILVLTGFYAVVCGALKASGWIQRRGRTDGFADRAK